MTWDSIALSLGIMTLSLGYITSQVKNTKYDNVKGFFFLLTVLHTSLLGVLPFLISLNPTDVSTFNPVAEGYFVASVITFIAYVYLHGFKLIMNIFSGGKDKNEEE